jgi:hypothetical protein
LNRFVDVNRQETELTFGTCVRVNDLRESEKQLKSFTNNEFSKLGTKYSTILDHNRLNGQLEKQLQAIDSIVTQFEKQTSNFQSRFTNFEN